MRIPGLILGVFLALSPHLATARKPTNAVLLSNVKTLTLRGDQLTSARRVDPISQLTCVGGNARTLYSVDVMRCHNSGSEYDTEDVQWTCQASLPPEFKLGSTEVICEGYDSPDDPYVLKGSCGVEYRLVLTEQGEAKYGELRGGWAQGRDEEGSTTSPFFQVVFWIVFLGIIGVLAYNIFTGGGRNANNAGPRQVGWGGGGGGGGGWGDDRPDDDEPPPPYTRQSPPRSKDPSSTYPSSSQAGENWRPGFWTGAAAAGAAGYMMGNRNNTNGGRTRNEAQERPSGWFGGRQEPAGRPNWDGSNVAGPSSPSSSRHESTGFGGTRRR